MGTLENRVAIITGGSRGIGRGIVELFNDEGATVIFSYRSSSKEADQIVKDLGNERLVAVQSDASLMSDAEKLIEMAMDRFGRIDVLINNAGITEDNLMLRMTEDQWNRVIKINLNSVFNLTKSVLRPMLRQRGGSIINMSSVVGVFGNAGQANYAASKAGIIGFSKSVAKEIGSRGIRCNVVAPGFIQTEMTKELPENVKNAYSESIPLKRFGEVEDVARTCLFLASDNSKYITGQVLSVCGGLNM